jgi:hypothetical protein
MTPHDELRRLAEAARHGGWISPHAWSAFHDAANPARILALLDEVEALKSLLQCAEDGRQEQLANLKYLALRAVKGPTHD